MVRTVEGSRMAETLQVLEDKLAAFLCICDRAPSTEVGGAREREQVLAGQTEAPRHVLLH